MSQVGQQATLEVDLALVSDISSCVSAKPAYIDCMNSVGETKPYWSKMLLIMRGYHTPHLQALPRPPIA